MSTAAAAPTDNVHTLLTGNMFCTGDTPSPGSWVDAGFGRIRVCIDVPGRSVEGDIQDTRTDGYCVEAKFNEFAVVDGSFHSFPTSPPSMFGSARSCGALSHFYTAGNPLPYDALWKIRIYRSTAFVLALDTHIARLVRR